MNREANYHLARALTEQLKTPTDVKSIFDKGNIKELRVAKIEEHGLYKRPGFVDRGINSRELNHIIETARGDVENVSEELQPPPMLTPY